MKKRFTKLEIEQNQGCYTYGKLDSLFNNLGNNPTTIQLFDYLPINDFMWFIVRPVGGMSDKKIKDLHFFCAELIYKKIRLDFSTHKILPELEIIWQSILDYNSGKLSYQYLYNIRQRIEKLLSVTYKYYPAHIHLRVKAIFHYFNFLTVGKNFSNPVNLEEKDKVAIKNFLNLYPESLWTKIINSIKNIFK